MRRLTSLLTRLLHPRKQALEDAAEHFERGNGHLLSQYEVARILRGMQ
jgi:hypothetical protein